MAVRAVVILAVAAVSVARCGACEPDRPGDNTAASASAPASAPAPSTPPSASGLGSMLPHAPRLACRAIAVEGDVHLEMGADAGLVPVLLQGLVPTEGWLSLAAASRLTAKDPRTTREMTLRGPGRARACVNYTEETWLALGGFDSAVGAGESPGNEEWLVIPLGVVRYNTAKLSVDVRARDATLSVSSGTAFVLPADDARTRSQDGGTAARGDDGWLRIEGGTLAFSPTGAAAPLDAARTAAGRCVALGKDARELTGVVMGGGADGSTIVQQVTTRRLARAGCAVASLRVAALPPSDGSAALAQPLAEGNAGWNALPPPPPLP